MLVHGAWTDFVNQGRFGLSNHTVHIRPIVLQFNLLRKALRATVNRVSVDREAMLSGLMKGLGAVQSFIVALRAY